MEKALAYVIILALCLILVGVSVAKEEEEFPVPVEFKSTDMKDLGNFHGSVAANEQSGWHFWGGREPIVSPGWVVFPVTVYTVLSWNVGVSSLRLMIRSSLNSMFDFTYSTGVTTPGRSRS